MSQRSPDRPTPDQLSLRSLDCAAYALVKLGPNPTPFFPLSPSSPYPQHDKVLYLASLHRTHLPTSPTQYNSAFGTMRKSIEMKSTKGSAVLASSTEDVHDDSPLFAVDTVFWKRVFR